jgi:hypothetical protein
VGAVTIAVIAQRALIAVAPVKALEACGGALVGVYRGREIILAHRGRQRSYLSVACATPIGFTVATFPFARVSVLESVRPSAKATG